MITYWSTSFIAELFFYPAPPQMLWLSFRFSVRLTLGAFFAFLFVKISGNVRKALDANNRLLTVFFLGSLITWLSAQTISIVINLEDPLDTWWPTLLLLGYVAAAIISFLFYSKLLNTKLLLQRKEIEQENLQFYMSEIEQQQTAMARFRHDYQNILTSFHSFIKDKDWDGLEQYYVSKVEVASAGITQNDFALEALGKVKVQEIKGIIAAKLLMAQNMGINATFEADEEVDHILMDSVTLVRMLGIILDNAIEALTELGRGKLRVACLKTRVGVMFIVQNDCDSNIPGLHQLKQDGFTTKGKERGLGLNILSELVNENPNISLETDIKDNLFTQRILIEAVK